MNSCGPIKLYVQKWQWVKFGGGHSMPTSVLHLPKEKYSYCPHPPPNACAEELI